MRETRSSSIKDAGGIVYLRHSTVRKNGKAHTYWRLIRSVRHGAKVRQETVANLGPLTKEERTKASALARHFLGGRAEQHELFEDRRELAPQKVRLGRVRVERTRGFGDVWLAWQLWRALGLEEFCTAAMSQGRESVSWPTVAAILVIARLCEPSSELHIAEDWYRKVALDDILGVDPAQVHERRLYEGLDQLLPHKEALEAHLKEKLGTLFALEYDLLLYDITSTYFEGEAKLNELAKHGHSRDHRPDCKQVCIGLVVTRDGYPLGYQVFAGNRSDVTTVKEIVELMEKRYGKARRIFVMDRGMASAQNFAWLREGGRQFLLGTPRAELKKWERELIDREGWKEVREGLEVKLCPGPYGTDTFILCRSAARQAKEQAMHERFSKRIVDGLETLAKRLREQRRRADRSQVDRQLGRLLQRNSRAAAKFTCEAVNDDTTASGLRLDWHENPEWNEWAKHVEGTYILRSNVPDLSAEDLWRAYVQLNEAEGAFRAQKSELDIRPIWHQRTERVEAHILVCFIAYVMWKTLQGWQKRAGLGDSPRTVLDELQRLQSIDVVLPVVDGPEVRLRCVAQPDNAQADILDRLGVQLPRRLRIKTEETEM